MYDRKFIRSYLQYKTYSLKASVNLYLGQYLKYI